MNRIVTVATIAVMIPFVIATAVPVSPSSLLGTAVLELVANALGDVVLRLEEPEPPAPMRDVVDVAGQRLREAVHLVDERREEERAERGQPERA